MIERRSGRRSFLALCGAQVLGGCVQFGRTAGEGSAHDRDQRTPDTVWQEGINAVTAPEEVGNLVLVGTETGLTALKSDDGRVHWERTDVGTPTGTPVVTGESVYVPTLTGDQAVLWQFHLETGQANWRQPLHSDRLFRPAVTDDTLYVRGTAGTHAVDVMDGTELWHHESETAYPARPLHVGVSLSPTVSDRSLISPEPDGVVALAPADGTEHWKASVDKVYGTPTVTDDAVYVSGVKTGVVKLSSSTGEKEWTWDASGIWTAPAVESDRVFATAGFDLVELAASDGSLRWRTNGSGLHGDIYTDPVFDDGQVILGSLSRTVSAYDTAGDSNHHSWSIEGGTKFSLVLSGDRIYAVDNQGEITAFVVE